MWSTACQCMFAANTNGVTNGTIVQAISRGARETDRVEVDGSDTQTREITIRLKDKTCHTKDKNPASGS